jgi:hypothetical protein
MSAEQPEIDILTRREIEARLLGPVMDKLSSEFGVEKTQELLNEVISQLAKDSGVELANELGGNSLAHLSNALQTFAENGECELEVLRLTDHEYAFNMTKCKYADMYKSLGRPKLGLLLSCNRDFAFCRGFNPGIKLKRTQTIMEGAEFCDFRFTLTLRNETEKD